MSRAQILCIDDDEYICKFIEMVLVNLGYQVLIASNGKQALEKLKTSMPDLILLDVEMPDMDGYQVCSALQKREKTAYIPIIFISALNQDQNKAKAFAMGAADYLVKPLTPNALTEKITLHLKTNQQWQKLRQTIDASHTSIISQGRKFRPSDYIKFKKFLCGQLDLKEEQKNTLLKTPSSCLYQTTAKLEIADKKLVKYIAQFLEIEYLEKINPENVKLGSLPAPFCRSNNIVAVHDPKIENTYVLSNPFNWELLDTLKNSIEHYEESKFIVTHPQNIQKLLENNHLGVNKPTPPPATSEEEMADIEEKLRQRYEQVTTVNYSEDMNEESEPLILLVNGIIEKAYQAGASDIHIEPEEREIVIRYRVDGNLCVSKRLQPPSLIRPLIARLKIMSKLDITEKRLPQDGRIIYKNFCKGRWDFDLRVATAPMNFGEKVVMRILDKQKSVLALEKLGFSQRHLQMYREKISTPYGMILHVGPTGSGKSMTLYAALNEISKPEINIQTIEDPIEYTLPGINQLQTHNDIGLTFGRALRSYLRQDPDVILVGEIRDLETAKIAIEASLTGHLLFSTLHTNDAPSTVTRFVEMGIEPFMVSTSLVLVCAQRLLRVLCPDCKKASKISAMEQQLLGGLGEIIYKPQGCPKCNNSGYKGRIGTHEILTFDDTVREAIVQKEMNAEKLKHIAVEKCNMTTLYWDAAEKVRKGICSLEDVMTKVRKDDWSTRPQWMLEENSHEEKGLEDQKKQIPLEKEVEIASQPVPFPAAPGRTVVLTEEEILETPKNGNKNVFQNHMALLQKQYLNGLPEKLKSIASDWNKLCCAWDATTLNQLYQRVHKLSGSGATYGLTPISNTSRSFEQLLQEFKSSDSLFNEEAIEKCKQFIKNLEDLCEEALKCN